MKSKKNLEVGTMKEEGLKLFSDIKESCRQVSSLVSKITSKLDSNFPLDHGMSLLDVKSHMLLSYITDLVYVMTLKCHGQSIENHQVIDRLIEGRVVLERIKPIDQKLKYQIDKLVKISSTGVLDAADPSQFKANPDSMMAKFDSEDEEHDEEEEGDKKIKKKDGGVYVPPKLAPAYYDGDESKAEKEKRLLERARKHALTSSIIQDLKEEYLDTPVEVKSTNSLTQKLDKFEKRKQEYEETYFTRLPVTKADKQRRKRVNTLGMLGEDLTKFEDISALDGRMPTVLKSSKKRKASGGKKGKKKKKKFH